MNKTTNFKKYEKNLYIGFINTVSIIWGKIRKLFNIILSIGNHKLTLMIIPHSEKRVFNLRINVFLLSTIVMVVGCSLGIIAFLTLNNYNTSTKYIEASYKAQLNEKRSREYEELLNEIFDAHKAYKTKQDILASKLNSPTIMAMKEAENSGKGQGGPENFIEKTDMTDFDYTKMESVKLLKDYNQSVQVFNEVNKMVDVYNIILKDQPFGVPVRGFYTITSTFGLRIHPIFKVLDNHQGIDLAHEPGTPIQATAPGTVEKVAYNAGGYGWHIIVRHNLGYSTLYAHLISQPIVSPGEKVKKNQIIGYMGRTGISTGVHLHYEIRLANKPVDPWPYIAIY